MPVPIQPIPLWEQTVTELGVILTGAILVCGIALVYFRRVRMERPPVGAFNGRDVVVLLIVIGILPFVYGWLPVPLVTCLLCLASASALHIGYRPLLGRTGIWLGIGVLIGFNIWSSDHLMGSLPGWQLWFAEQGIAVVLIAVAVCNLYVQGGMKLRHVAWLALGLAGYDILFAAYYPLTGGSSPATSHTRSSRWSVCDSAMSITLSASATCSSTHCSSLPRTRATAHGRPRLRAASWWSRAAARQRSSRCCSTSPTPTWTTSCRRSRYSDLSPSAHTGG